MLAWLLGPYLGPYPTSSPTAPRPPPLPSPPPHLRFISASKAAEAETVRSKSLKSRPSFLPRISRLRGTCTWEGGEAVRGGRGLARHLQWASIWLRGRGGHRKVQSRGRCFPLGDGGSGLRAGAVHWGSGFKVGPPPHLVEQDLGGCVGEACAHVLGGHGIDPVNEDQHLEGEGRADPDLDPAGGGLEDQQLQGYNGRT